MGRSKEAAPKMRRSLLQERKWRPKATNIGIRKMERLAAES
jgi:hypothetical protein